MIPPNNPPFLRKRSASALLFSLVLLGIFTVLSVVFIERLYPFSQNVAGIERANMAYYAMTTAIEGTMNTSSGRVPWIIQPQSTPSTQIFTGYTVQVMTGGTTLPAPGLGESAYDPDWGIISRGQSIQLVLPSGLNMNTMTITFRVPDLNNDGNNTEALQLGSGSISAKLIVPDVSNPSNRPDFSSRSNSMITTIATPFTIGNINVTPLQGAESTVDNFYSINASACDISQGNCTLKFSVNEPFFLATGDPLPYLEYQIKTGNIAIPLQFTTMNVQGRVYGYARSRVIPLIQLTTNAAYNVAVSL